MKKFSLVVLIVIIQYTSQAQALKTLFRWDTTGMGSFKGYGEMFVKGTFIKNEPTIMIGGRCGFILNRKVAFGGIGSGYLVQSSLMGTDLMGNANADLNIRMGAGGIFMEYIHNMESAIHFSIPISFTIGNLEITKAPGGNRIEGSRVLMIEPAINLEFNFSKFLIIAITGGYRIASINRLVNLSNGDLSGPVIGLVGKFASF